MAAEVAAKRKEGQPTVPSLLGDELKCNPFLRPGGLLVACTCMLVGMHGVVWGRLMPPGKQCLLHPPNSQPAAAMCRQPRNSGGTGRA